jgi:hypothetical protein
MEKSKLVLIGFMQALGLSVYCGLVAFFIWNANSWFGKITDFRGPLLFLVLFSTSVLISALVTLSYPFILFYQKKQPIKALRLIIYTSGFLVFFTLLAFFLLLK